MKKTGWVFITRGFDSTEYEDKTLYSTSHLVDRQPHHKFQGVGGWRVTDAADVGRHYCSKHCFYYLNVLEFIY